MLPGARLTVPELVAAAAKASQDGAGVDMALTIIKMKA
mgnify:CR=1 FL=1